MTLAALTFLAVQLHSSQGVQSFDSEVMYQIFPRSFRDSNGDGHGDFKGIEQGLPMLKELGITMVLLNPIYKSRTYHNYFADDWFQVDPEFGTLEDLRSLLRSAKNQGIRFILDIEPQYTADQHPWAVAAKADPNTAPGNYLSNFSLPGLGTSPWYDGAKIGISTVNLKNPNVVNALTDNCEFWVDQGFSGFRIDHMMDNLDWQGKMTKLYAELWKPLEEKLLAKNPNLFFVGEQADWESFRAGIEILEQTPTQAVFNFRQRMFLMPFVKGMAEKSISEYRWFTPANKIQVNFLENHDVVRFASEFGDLAKQRLAAGLLLSLRGLPSIYYGQELGMKGRQGNWGKDGNDIPIRLGYRWSRKLDDGLTPRWYKGTGPWASDQYSKDNDGIDLESQRKDPRSLYSWYKKLIGIRRENSALTLGSQEVKEVASDTVTVVERKHGNSSVLICVNFGEKPARVAKYMDTDRVDLISNEKFGKGDDLRLRPYGIALLSNVAAKVK